MRTGLSLLEVCLPLTQVWEFLAACCALALAFSLSLTIFSSFFLPASSSSILAFSILTRCLSSFSLTSLSSLLLSSIAVSSALAGTEAVAWAGGPIAVAAGGGGSGAWVGGAEEGRAGVAAFPASTCEALAEALALSRATR